MELWGARNQQPYQPLLHCFHQIRIEDLKTVRDASTGHISHVEWVEGNNKGQDKVSSQKAKTSGAETDEDRWM